MGGGGGGGGEGEREGFKAFKVDQGLIKEV